MPLVLADRVKETSTTTGTGTITLAGASTGYQSFSAGIGVGNTCYYAIHNQGTNEWEVGLGTVGSGTLSRDTILASSNSGSLVTFSAGTKDVFVTYPAKKQAMTSGLTENNTLISSNYTITTDANAMSVGPITVASGVTVTVPSGSRWVVL